MGTRVAPGRPGVQSTELDVQLPEILTSKRTAIVDRWLDLTLEVYPEDAARFMRREKDRFGNPVGQVTREALEALFEGLLAGVPDHRMDEALDGVVRIRAVQDLPPSAAVGFVFLLKQAVRDELGEAGASHVSPRDLAALHSGIDRLALRAFNLFVGCREKIYDLRASEIRRRMASLLKRLEGVAAEDRDGPRC
jgi:hypothetical protein